MNISPLRYPGGKTRACKILDEIINKYFDIDSYSTLISPFFGGGSFEFYMQNKYNYYLIVNDKFTPLYNFWNQIKINKLKLYEKLMNISSINKEDFINYRKSIFEFNNNPLQQAFQYFIINRCSFSGATLSGGFSEEASKKRFTLSSINKIKNLDLEKVDIYNDDFEDFINKIYNANNSENYLLFLDPPYYLNNKSKLYGKNGDMHENFEHEKLFQIIKYKKNWIMTYNNCDYIKNLYKDFIILDASWTYSMNKSKESSEIVIISI
jgi:DNA adenine methylase